ncbi:MSHA biogenesis protein MshO [Shewanella sp. AS1]|nr:MSHA biogenesis protein MshO [Shewanella sp. AS1]
MVTVIIILGVLVIGSSSFLIFGTRIFVESTSVDQVLGQSRFVIERLTRELRNAAPNSLRVTSTADYQCVEFVPILAGGSYLQLPVAPAAPASSGNIMPASISVSGTEKLLVYPQRPADFYASQPSGTVGQLFNIKKLTGDIIEFERAVQFAKDSPQKRYYLVDDAVSYCFLQAGEIRRYDHYGLRALQGTPATLGPGVLMAQNLANHLQTEPALSFTPGTLTNHAVVQLSPRFSVNGQVFHYQHQVQVINVP